VETDIDEKMKGRTTWWKRVNVTLNNIYYFLHELFYLINWFKDKYIIMTLIRYLRISITELEY